VPLKLNLQVAVNAYKSFVMKVVDMITKLPGRRMKYVYRYAKMFKPW